MCIIKPVIRLAFPEVRTQRGNKKSLRFGKNLRNGEEVKWPDP